MSTEVSTLWTENRFGTWIVSGSTRLHIESITSLMTSRAGATVRLLGGTDAQINATARDTLLRLLRPDDRASRSAQKEGDAAQEAHWSENRFGTWLHSGNILLRVESITALEQGDRGGVVRLAGGETRRLGQETVDVLSERLRTPSRGRESGMDPRFRGDGGR